MSVGKPESAENARLMSAIAAFADNSETSNTLGRLLISADSTAEARFEAVLREINETVLHRTLHVKSRASAELRLDVAERRVLRLQFHPDSPVGLQSNLPGKALCASDVGALHASLETFCVQSADLRVISGLPTEQTLTVEEGVTHEALFAYHHAKAAIGGNPIPYSEQIMQTLAICRSCCVWCPAITPVTIGAPRDIEVLEQFYGLSDEKKPVVGDVLVWAIGDDSKHAVLNVYMENLRCLATVAKIDLTRVLEIWRPVL